MPGVHPGPCNVHDAGGETDGAAGAGVSGEKLVSGEKTFTCNATKVFSSEDGRVRLYCTERKRHHGDHYDKVFSVAWLRRKRNG